MNNVQEDLVPVPSLQQQNADKRWAVRLRVYDISKGMARVMSPMLLGRQINGVWHTGVEVYGTEYFYGGGICSMPPAEVERVFQLSPSRVIFMGFTTIDKSVCDDLLNGISHRFTEATYDLLNWNCNHFSEEMTQFLVNKLLPDEIRNQVQQVAESPMSRFLLPLLQQQQRAVQEASSAAGQRTLWTQGKTNSDTPSGCLSSSSSPSSAVRATGGGAATADDEWPSSTPIGGVGTPRSRLGAVLRRVCVNEELVYSTKRVFLLTLLTLVNNLLSPQRDIKHMRVRYGNPVIQSKVLRVPGGEEALKLLGFERVKYFDDKESCNDPQNTAFDNSHTSAAQNSQGEKSDLLFNAEKNGEDAGGFAFKQFKQGGSEQSVLDQLHAHKAEIEAFLAALDRNRQKAAAATAGIR